MARAPMVTRTLITTKATCLCLNVTTAEPYNETFIMPRTYKDMDTLTRIIQGKYNTDDCKIVAVVATEQIETLYGMTETDFVKYAQVLPARGKKVSTDETKGSESTDCTQTTYSENVSALSPDAEPNEVTE